MRGELIGCIFHLNPAIHRKMTDGWDCVNPVKCEEGDFQIVLHEFLRPGQEPITGRETYIRGRKAGARAGLFHAEAVLRDCDKIPPIYRYNYLIFPEAWRCPDGYWKMFGLHWRYGCWQLRYNWFGPGFASNGRVVRVVKYKKILAGDWVPGQKYIEPIITGKQNIPNDWRPGSDSENKFQKALRS